MESSPEREDPTDSTYVPPFEEDTLEEDITATNQVPEAVIPGAWSPPPATLRSNLGTYWSTPGSRRPIQRRNVQFADEDEICNQTAEAAHTESCFFTEYYSHQQLLEKHEANVVNLKLEIAAFQSTLSVPRSYSDAMKSSDRKGWNEAMKKELESLRNYAVYDTINFSDVPRGEKLIDSTWIFAIKAQNNSSIKKARLCVRGDTEQGDFTVEEIFSGVIRSENVKLMLGIICRNRWPMVVIDVKTAFLNAKLDKQIYLRITRGAPFDRGKECWKLKKALYGLRKAPKAWNDDLTHTLLSLGYTKCELVWNLFVRKGNNGSATSYIAFHVDDGLISASTKNILDQVLHALKNKYEIKVDWNPTKYLGIHFEYSPTNGEVYMNQSSYIEESALKYRVEDMRPFKVPMDPGFVSSWTASDTPVTNEPYRGIVGVLSRIARQTRPDILYAFSVLSTHLAKPAIRH